MKLFESISHVEINEATMILIGIMLLLGAMAKWRMFVKADQPGLAAVVPGWDLIVTLRMVGRPDYHILFFLIPVFNVYFLFKLLIEIAQSFGKNSIIDYIFTVVFNVFYMLNLGLAFNEYYYGPVYGRSVEELQARKPYYATT
ncbi:MAG: hypothetical protein RL226_465 [Bacteroidota bacterium]|jgi:hypothetical protein